MVGDRSPSTETGLVLQLEKENDPNPDGADGVLAGIGSVAVETEEEKEDLLDSRPSEPSRMLHRELFGMYSSSKKNEKRKSV